jgi:solute carrier family 27 fatty acid transporter 1/4
MAGVAARNANKLLKDDIIYATLPLYHTNSGVVGASQTIVNGCTLALRDKFSASNFWKDCIKYNATVSKCLLDYFCYYFPFPFPLLWTKVLVRVEQ